MARGWIAALLVLLFTRAVSADDHLVRSFDARNGFDFEWTSTVARDTQGFLWIGTPGGLLRYDGYTIEPWARTTLDVRVTALRPAADGTLYVITTPHLLWHVVGTEATRVDLPDASDALPEPDNGLWVIAGDSLRHRDADGNWRTLLTEVDHPKLIRRGAGSALWLASRSTVWRVDGNRTTRVTEGTAITDILPVDNGVVVLQSDGAVLFSDGQDTRRVFEKPGARGISLARRGDVTWVGYDIGLVALRPGRVEVMSRDGDIPSAGPLFVDREGSLWVASFQGLLQLPEPDTSIFGLREGMPTGPRRLARTAEGIWVATWFGLGRIDSTGRVHDEHQMVRAGVCVDHSGRLWSGDEESFLVRVDGRFEHYPIANGHAEYPEGCAPARDGGVWLTRGDGLFHAPSEPGLPIPIAIPSVDGRVTAVMEDRHDRLWLARGDWGCWADMRLPVSTASWSCRKFGGTPHVMAFVETDAGHIWASAHQVGVVRFDEDAATWRVIAGSAQLRSRDIYAVASSSRGGVWIVGSGILLRVLDRPDLSAGWEVVETPGASMGLYAADGEDVLEDPDGALWITQARGVHFIPRAVRDQTTAPPSVTLIGLTVDGQRREASHQLELPSGDHQLELELSALAFRDPARVRYRVRLSREGQWSAPSREQSYRFVDLPAGEYELEASASLDGVTWAPVVGLHVAIARVWYLRWWAIAAAVAIAVAVVCSIHRVRLAVHLRFERQRSRIAMDLHDEMGSGLGSIGILAELANERELPDIERKKITTNIAETAEELSGALGDIVWSLHARSATLDNLVTHVRERASRLFSASADLEFVVPAELPATPVTLAVRSNVPRIAFEALHNAARHATARRIVVTFERVGVRWRMSIEDDGIGLAQGGQEATGLGLTSMRKRAEEIGARLAIESRPAGGTRVELVFVPDAHA
jgi:signal transduction histidine kinase